jgi:hypothetical protein
MLDLARTGMSVEGLTFAFHEAAYHELLDLRDVDDLLTRCAGARGVTRLRAATAAHRAGKRGSRSALERRVATYLGACGAPRPEFGDPIRAGDEIIEVDLHWPAHRLVVEVDGPGHRRPAAQRQDAHRELALERVGLRLVRISLDDFEADPAAAVRPVLVALRL